MRTTKTTPKPLKRAKSSDAIAYNENAYYKNDPQTPETGKTTDANSFDGIASVNSAEPTEKDPKNYHRKCLTTKCVCKFSRTHRKRPQKLPPQMPDNKMRL